MKALNYVLSISMILQGCATANKTKSVALIGVGASAGAIYGATRPEEKSRNAVMYGSIVALGAALLSLHLFDDSKVASRLKQEKEMLEEMNSKLKIQLDPKLSSQGGNLLSAPLPKEVRHLIKPGGWRRYKLDRWIQDEQNENTWFRQTEMFEVIPPSVGTN